MIEVKLPVKKSDDQEQTDYGSERDNDISGRYLVSELKHIIGNSKANTQLKLVRDVFTA